MTTKRATLPTIRRAISNLVILTLCLVAGNSCTQEPEDGDWEAMKWKTEVKKDKDGMIRIPAEAGTYTFTCANYSFFWISSVTEGTNDISPDKDSHKAAEGEWSHIKVEGDVLTVAIDANTSTGSRALRVYVTAGDIFADFTFIQAPPATTD